MDTKEKMELLELAEIESRYRFEDVFDRIKFIDGAEWMLEQVEEDLKTK